MFYNPNQSLTLCITHVSNNLTRTVPPKNTYPLTEVLPWPIRRLTPRSRLGKDAARRNITEVLPRFGTAYNIAVNGRMR